jgi:hypothetical protein
MFATVIHAIMIRAPTIWKFRMVSVMVLKLGEYGNKDQSVSF